MINFPDALKNGLIVEIVFFNGHWVTVSQWKWLD
jgi:hypothetical protein